MFGGTLLVQGFNRRAAVLTLVSVHSLGGPGFTVKLPQAKNVIFLT